MDAHVYGERRTVTGLFPDYADPSRTAVVSIDLHEGHLSEDPDCPCPAPRMRAVVGPVNAFHARCRMLGIPVIHVRSVLRKGGVDDVKGFPSAWRRTFPLYAGPIPNAAGHAIEGSRWTRFVTEVAEEDLIVSTKKRLSAFFASDLDLLLRNLEARILVLDGGMTDCCVLNTAFDGANRDYRIIVARDLVRGTNPDMEDAALKMVSLHLGLVMDAEDILAMWRDSSVRRDMARSDQA